MPTCDLIEILKHISETTHLNFYEEYDDEIEYSLTGKGYAEIAKIRDYLFLILFRRELTHKFDSDFRISLISKSFTLYKNPWFSIFNEHFLLSLRLIPKLSISYPTPNFMPCKPCIVNEDEFFYLKSKCLLRNFLLGAMDEFYNMQFSSKNTLRIMEGCLWSFFTNKWPTYHEFFFDRQKMKYKKHVNNWDKVEKWSDLDDCYNCHGVDLCNTTPQDCDGVNLKAVKQFFYSKLWRIYCKDGKRNLRRCQIVNFLKDHLSKKKNEICKVCYS
jgi:hypothetical protein